MEFQIDVMQCITGKYYYIYLKTNNKTYVADEDMSELLGMSKDDYILFILSYGAVYRGIELTFVTQFEAEIFVKYLNENYLVILMLAGKI